MKIKFICLLIFWTMHCFAQKNIDSYLVKGKGFEGYIFSKTYAGFLPLETIKDRFTPQQSDILEAEKIIKEQLLNLNKNLLNQTGSCPIIHKKLKEYKRQYIGTLNENGDSIIWINFIWEKDKESIKRCKNEIIITLDGCRFYWNVKVNLTKRELFDLIINGQS